VVALGFAVAPVAGQNVGARKADRVRGTFVTAAAMAGSGMLILAIVVEFAAGGMVQVFSRDPDVVAVGEEYLQIIAWNFFASGIMFVSSSMFQARGNTIPSLVASFTRIVLVAVPALLLARLPGFDLRWLWYLSVGAATLQMFLSLLLLRREFHLRLNVEHVIAA
jgi:Na+-driven multidrug efflux pump